MVPKRGPDPARSTAETTQPTLQRPASIHRETMPSYCRHPWPPPGRPGEVAIAAWWDSVHLLRLLSTRRASCDGCQTEVEASQRPEGWWAKDNKLRPKS